MLRTLKEGGGRVLTPLVFPHEGAQLRSSVSIVRFHPNHKKNSDRFGERGKTDLLAPFSGVHTDQLSWMGGPRLFPNQTAPSSPSRLERAQKEASEDPSLQIHLSKVPLGHEQQACILLPSGKRLRFTYKLEDVGEASPSNPLFLATSEPSPQNANKKQCTSAEPMEAWDQRVAALRGTEAPPGGEKEERVQVAFQPPTWPGTALHCQPPPGYLGYKANNLVQSPPSVEEMSKMTHNPN
eukprot:Platyproteum_vivax@DN16819_c0_g1_i1.p1